MTTSQYAINGKRVHKATGSYVVFCAARFDICVRVTHIIGTTNVIADALSRSQIKHSKQLVLNVADLSDRIPAWPTQFWTDWLYSTSH